MNCNLPDVCHHILYIGVLYYFSIVPTTVAEIVSGVRTSPHTLEVQFVPISQEDNNGEINSYIVTYSPSINNSCFETYMPTMI